MSKLADYYRLIELADRMRRDGLSCPRCGAVSVAHQLVDNSTDPHLACASCGESFIVEDLVVEPVFEKDADLVVLYRPVGPHEVAKIEATGWTRFPPRLPEQPIFYPVLNQRYAEYIAEKWNVPDSHVGYVTRFLMNATTAKRYPVQVVGGAWCQDLCTSVKLVRNRLSESR